jgi:3-deoxy-D-manno-octulosonate 8-phosphate phosphatase (KDO 8-P phosphatase)
MNEILTNKAKKIRLVVFDVDGVLTNGSLILGEKGEEYKVFHVHDGLGLVMLRESGLKIAVISARSTPIVAERMAALGIDYVYQGQSDKQSAIIELMKKMDVSKEETAFAGDDLIDLPAMRQTGLAIAVANAQPLVLEHADWVTLKAGGQGAVREICEMILSAQGLLESAHQRYLSN